MKSYSMIALKTFQAIMLAFAGNVGIFSNKIYRNFPAKLCC
jgi:hypothetical protein